MSRADFHARPARRSGLASTAVLLAVAVLAGCGSDDPGTSPSTTTPSAASTSTSTSTTSTTATTPSAEVCADLAAARTSLQALVDTKITEEGTDTFNERLATLQSDVEALLQSAKDQLADQSTATKDSVAALVDALDALKQDPTASNLARVRSALQDVKLSAQDLVAALESGC